MEVWREIIEFPGYSVSSDGRVRNDRYKNVLTPTVNRQGISYVGLVRDGVQHKRSVSPIVANTFLKPPVNSNFDTPIHLDGDWCNSAASNLMWRPRWFAIRFHSQFVRKNEAGPVPEIPVEDVDTGQRFADIWDVVSTFGVMWIEVYSIASNYTHHGSRLKTVWPTNQQFRLL